MNTLDILLGSILLIAIVIGFQKGFIASLISLLRFFIAAYIAIYYMEDIKPYMQWIGEQAEIIYQLVAFIVCFIVVSILLFFLSKLVTNLLNILALGVLNRMLGATFNGIKYALILSLILFSFTKINMTNTWIDQTTKKDSYLYTPIYSIAPSLFPIVTEWFENSEKNNQEDF